MNQRYGKTFVILCPLLSLLRQPNSQVFSLRGGGGKSCFALGEAPSGHLHRKLINELLLFCTQADMNSVA